MQQASVSEEGSLFRSHHWQRQEVGVIAVKPWQQASAEKGRLARARGAKNDQQTRWRAFAHAAQTVESVNDRPLATEENARILSL